MYQQLPDGQIQVYKLPTGVVPVLVSTAAATDDQKQLLVQQQQQPQQIESRRSSQDEANPQQDTIVKAAVSNGGAAAAAAAAVQVVSVPASAPPRQAVASVEQQCGQCKQAIMSGMKTDSLEQQLPPLPVPQNTPVRVPPPQTTAAEAVEQQLSADPLPEQPPVCQNHCSTEDVGNVSGTALQPVGSSSNPALSASLASPSNSFFELNPNSFRYLTTPVKVVGTSGVLSDALIRTPIPQTAPAATGAAAGPPRFQLVYNPTQPPNTPTQRKNSLPTTTKLNIYPASIVQAGVDVVCGAGGGVPSGLRRGSLPVAPPPPAMLRALQPAICEAPPVAVTTPETSPVKMMPIVRRESTERSGGQEEVNQRKQISLPLL